MSSDEVVGPAGSRRRYVIFAIAACALMMSSIDQTIVATALPTLQRAFHKPLNLVGWTITIYTFGRIIVQPLVGRIGDVLGRRMTFVVSLAVFTLASLLCGLATDIYVLIALRAIQSIGGGAFIPSATDLVAEHFGASRDRAVGLFSSVSTIGAIVGPIFGGIFITYWSWRAIFLVNVPVGIVLLLLGMRYIPRDVGARGERVDLVGAGLLSVTLLSGAVAITYLGEQGASVLSVWFFAPLVLALVAGWRLIGHLRSVPDPILPISLLQGRGFGVMNVINLLYGSAAIGFSALVPLYAQNRYGIPSLASGTLLTARGVGVIVVSGLATLALRRTGYRPPMLAGFTVTAAALILMAHGPIGLTPYQWLAFTTGLAGLGIGMSLPASNNASIQLDPSRAGVASGLRSTIRQIGSMLAVSVSTAIVARSADPGIAQGRVFLGFGLVLLLVLPLVRLVPEHRGSW